jgi:hypothetical protein
MPPEIRREPKTLGRVLINAETKAESDWQFMAYDNGGIASAPFSGALPGPCCT